MDILFELNITVTLLSNVNIRYNYGIILLMKTEYSNRNLLLYAFIKLRAVVITQIALNYIPNIS